jgi:hypothetical protein
MNWIQHRFDIPTPNERLYLLGLEEIVDKYIPKNGKLLANSGAFSPALMYFAHRIGWAVNIDVLQKKEWMPEYTKLGMTHILVYRHSYDLPLPYNLVFESPDFRIYKP